MNRREFLHHFSTYLAATGATCAGCNAAFGQWSGGSTLFSAFQVEGCSLTATGAANIRLKFLMTSGYSTLDALTRQELNLLVAATGYQPSFAFLNDITARNALASSHDIVFRRSRHGAVMLGVGLLLDMLNKPAINPYNNGWSIVAILMHEWTHIAQFQIGVQAPRTVQKELMADYVAGWYIGAKQIHIFRRAHDVTPAIRAFFELGDTNFNSSNHHGTPQQRANALIAGLQFGLDGRTGFWDAFRQGHALYIR